MRGGSESGGGGGPRLRPPIRRVNRDRLGKRTKRGRRRDFLQKFRRSLFTGTKFGQADSCGIAKIRQRETLGSFVVKAARARGVSTALGIAAKPIEGVNGIGRHGVLQEECG